MTPEAAERFTETKVAKSGFDVTPQSLKSQAGYAVSDAGYADALYPLSTDLAEIDPPAYSPSKIKDEGGLVVDVTDKHLSELDPDPKDDYGLAAVESSIASEFDKIDAQDDAFSKTSKAKSSHHKHTKK